MKSNRLYKIVFDNFLPKICDMNSYCLFIIRGRKRIIYCFAINDNVLTAFDFDGIIGEFKEIDIDEINPHYSIKLLEKPISLKELKAKYELLF